MEKDKIISIFKKPWTRLLEIVLWTVTGYLVVVLIAILIMGVVIVCQLYKEEGMYSPDIRMAVGVLISLILITSWFLFRKNKSLLLFIHDSIPFLFVGAVLYFWYRASDWENLMTPDWPNDPLRGHVISILEYLKALVKTVMLGSVAIIASLYLKKDTKPE